MSKAEAPIIVTVCGSTTDEIRSKLVELAKQFGYEDRQESLPLPISLPNHAMPNLQSKESAEAAQAAHVPTDEPTEGSSEASHQTPKEEKRGRHAKDCDCAKCAAKNAEKAKALEAQAPAPAPTTAGSKDIVMLRMQSLLNLFPNDKPKSMAKVREILGQFGATKFTELKEESYGAFVMAADSVLRSA